MRGRHDVPKKPLGLIALTNISGRPANDALMAIAEALCKRFGQSP